MTTAGRCLQPPELVGQEERQTAAGLMELVLLLRRVVWPATSHVNTTLGRMNPLIRSLQALIWLSAPPTNPFQFSLARHSVAQSAFTQRMFPIPQLRLRCRCAKLGAKLKLLTTARGGEEAADAPPLALRAS